MYPKDIARSILQPDRLFVRDGKAFYRANESASMRPSEKELVDIGSVLPVKKLEPQSGPEGTMFRFELSPAPDFIWLMTAKQYLPTSKCDVFGSVLTVTSTVDGLEHDYANSKALLNTINKLYREVLAAMIAIAHEVEAERKQRADAQAAHKTKIDDALDSLKL